jgi:MFS family permease
MTNPETTASATRVEIMDEQHHYPTPASSMPSTSPLFSPLLSQEEIRREKRQKTTLLIFASCSIFLFAGSFYGWGPMQLLLESNGNFGTECNSNADEKIDDTNEAVCPEQTAALLNCRFISQLTILTGPILGYMSDRYGGTTLTCCMGFSILSGLSLLMVAVKFPGTIWDSILYVAFILLGLGSTAGGLLTVETGLLFRNRDGGTTSKAQSRVISLLNALYDAGAMTYLGLWGLEKVTSNEQELSHVNLIAILAAYLTVAILCLGGYVWFFREVARKEPNKGYDGDTDHIKQFDPRTTSAEVQMGATEHTAPSRLPSNHISQLDISSNDDFNESTSNDIATRFTVNQQISRLSSQCEEAEEGGHVIDSSMVPLGLSQTPPKLRHSPNTERSYIPISQRTVVEQLKCKAYIFLCIVFSFHLVSNVWTLTTARDFLKYLGDDEYGNRYLTIFTLLTPVSLAALPFEDIAIHKFGFAWALQGVNFLGMMHGIVKVASTNLNVQIVGFVIFSFFRCFLFAVTFSCLASFTSASATGRAVGIMYVVSGAASFINIGLANLAVEQMNGDFFIPNLVFVVLTIPMFYVVYVIGKALDRDDLSKSDPESQALVSISEAVDVDIVDSSMNRTRNSETTETKSFST